MGYNWIGLFGGVAAVALFVVAHRLVARIEQRKRWRVVCAVGVAAAPGLYQAAYYLHLTSVPLWFYEARSWLGSELVVLPIGVFGGCLAAVLPRRALILPLLATVGGAAGPFLKPVLAPLPAAGFRVVWTKQVCIQSTLATCGPASLATILRELGTEATERDLARAAHSYRGGTEAWYLARVARARGFEATFRSEAGFPETVRWPAIIGVNVEGGRGHFIPFLGRNGDRYEIGDPMIGPERLTREELERRYVFTGFALEISRR